ncbi:sulfotransferase domain-containing protein, partial [Mycobacterium tuberculosis]|uniref:sulfotransferase domain-containing protein n=2 Tax=Mycobacterium tuberculosis TaxID=1773 RepID=UPI001F1D75D7
ARSRSSGGYLLDEPPDMTPSFPRTGVSGHAGAVHTDYQADLAGELLRPARVLGIAATRDRARDLAQYATLDAMRSRASEIAPNTTDGIWHSDERFFRRGGSGDWQQFFTEAEHLRYYHRINQLAPPDLLAWAHEGRRGYDPAN